ncbi:MAG TPA: M18 family aminopeptidase [Gammaproteobacteria bacterium]|nr:M18 family aminopeptidase [Gammaproteobacteria bacterium]
MSQTTNREATLYPEAQALLGFIDRSPTPWHATAEMVSRLTNAGFSPLDERERWSLQPGNGYFLIRDGSSLIAFRLGQEKPSSCGFNMIGAHTDSPGLRVKPNPLQRKQSLTRLGVEIYGGPILATFSDRDLALAGRLVVRGNEGLTTRLIRLPRPIARIPNLAIHMNREVNTKGLVLDRQDQLPPLLGAVSEELPLQNEFRQLLADQLREDGETLDAQEIVSWELLLFDSQPGQFYGPQGEFIANGQLDNLASCDASLTALIRSSAQSHTQLCGFFDHEEVGSESHKGAAGSFLADTLKRICEQLEDNPSSLHQALAKSFMISADMAHAWNPAFASAYDADHPVQVNGGPAIKINASQRYSSEAVSQALFSDWCAQVGVPVQHYVHRNDLPCGSTIGPITAAALGVRSVDVGNPMWSMHSARESAGAADHGMMIAVMNHFFDNPVTQL